MDKPIDTHFQPKLFFEEGNKRTIVDIDNRLIFMYYLSLLSISVKICRD